MLARLRHRPVVGRHHEHDMVNAGGAGEHVADQLFVARHIDEAEHAAVCRCFVRKAQVDRDAARFFFLQPVGVDAGERLDQRGFAMVDMPCGADDQRQSEQNGMAEMLAKHSTHDDGLTNLVKPE